MSKVRLTVSTVDSVDMLANGPGVGERVDSLNCQALATRETPKGARLQGEHGHDGKYAQHSDNLILGLEEEGEVEDEDEDEGEGEDTIFSTDSRKGV